jgi:hypothetical protein
VTALPEVLEGFCVEDASGYARSEPAVHCKHCDTDLYDIEDGEEMAEVFRVIIEHVPQCSGKN